MLPLLMFVHGVGAVRDIQADRSAWIAALADGARQAGHSRFANEVLSRVDVRFVHYADLFAPPDAAHAQGDIAMASAQLSGGAAFIASELLAGAVDEQLARNPAPAVRLSLERAKAQLAPGGQAQGSGDVGRRLLSAAMTLLDIPAIRRGAQWLSGMELLGHFAQAGRYLARGERDREGRTLDNRVRERVLAAMSDRPTVVVAHSLGSLVAVEALHEQTREVTLLVTIGSPMGMRTVVRPRLRPQPVSTPDCVDQWLNFWDRDDILATRPLLEADVCENARGVRPNSGRVDSDGLWVHSATTYLRHGVVAGRVVETLNGCQ